MTSTRATEVNAEASDGQEDDAEASRSVVTEKTGGKQLAASGSILGIAMILANGGNYLLNVFLGRWLTPSEFADANLMVTIMLLVTAIAISLQLIAARFAGINDVRGAQHETAALAAWLERRANIAGTIVAAILVVGAPFWSNFFNTESALPFVILGLGMPFYLIQAVGRGVLQGELTFRPLAATFVVEMLVRVTVGVALVAAGLGVAGATIGLTASFLATWMHVRLLTTKASGTQVASDTVRELITYAGPVGVLLLGQIIINNGDVLIAKRFLDPDTAGVYAAIALVGRAVFFLSWSVATTLFPAAAQRDEAGEESNGLLYGGLLIVALMGVVFVVSAKFLGGIVLGEVFGPEYADVSNPLALYAFATSMFAMANLIVSHHLSTGRLREALVLVAGGVLQTSMLLVGRGSIDSLIRAQVIAMAILLGLILTSHFIGENHKKGNVAPNDDPDNDTQDKNTNVPSKQMQGVSG